MIGADYQSIVSAISPLPTRRGLQLLLMTLVAWGGVYARFAVGPFQETLRVALSLSDNQIGLLQGPALAMPAALASIPIGLMIDRCSRVRLVLLLTSLTLIGSLFTMFASGFILLFASRCVVGLTATATSITVYALVADFYAPAQRARATMVVAIGEVAGAASAFAFGGLLIGWFGSEQNAWRWALICLLAPVVLVTFATIAMREAPRTDSKIVGSTTRSALPELWRYRSMVGPLLAARIMVGIADGAALIWAAPTFSREFAITPERIGMIMGIVLFVSGLVGPIAGGLLMDLSQRIGGPRRAMSVLGGLAALSVPGALFAVAPSVGSASVLLVIFITISNAIVVTVATLATVIVPNELRGTCMATLFAGGLLFGVGLAPMAVSLLSGALGGPSAVGTALSSVCVITSFLGVVALTLGRRHFPSLEKSQNIMGYT